MLPWCPLRGIFYWASLRSASGLFVREMFETFCESRREVRSTDQDKMLRSNNQTNAKGKTSRVGGFLVRVPTSPNPHKSFTMKNPRIYTYKVTFEEIPHWYWGVHKEKKYNDGYLGSPITHKWMWEFYTPKLTILEVFPNTGEGWKEAQLVEKRLIHHDLGNPWCLNEHCGGEISLSICTRVGEENVAKGRGMFSPSYQGSDKHRQTGKESGAKVGPKNVEEKRGVFSDDYQGTVRHRETGRRSGNQAVKNKTGIHSEEWKNSQSYKETRQKAGKNGGKSASSQVWESTVDGYQSTAGLVAIHNRRKGWDPNARVRVK